MSDEKTGIRWDERGLCPAIVQDAGSGQVLVLAWMNREALLKTFETGRVHFYSRSRQALWLKGETSGNFLDFVSMRTDCDSDAILVQARPQGPTCHTGTSSCFFRSLDQRGEVVSEDDGPAPRVNASIVSQLYRVLEARRDDADGEKSYTKSLLDKGFPKIEAKIREEAGELLEVLEGGPDNEVVHETADLLFHILVGWCARGLSIDALYAELTRRFGVSGHDEKASRAKETD